MLRSLKQEGFPAAGEAREEKLTAADILCCAAAAGGALALFWCFWKRFRKTAGETAQPLLRKLRIDYYVNC